MKRGVVAAPAIIRRLPGGFTMERSISAEELRFYILYWDHVVIPGNNLVYVGVPEEEAFVAIGAISRPRVQYSGRFEGDQVANAVLASQSIVATELAKASDIDWVLHQFGGDVLTLPGMSQETTSLRISVASVLPVPSNDVPIAEVMEFKERKQKDLRALHDCLDALYFDILKSPDKDLASRKLIADLREQVEAIGSGKRDLASWRRFDLSIEFSLHPKDLILGVSAGAALGFMTGWTLPITAGIGAVGSLLEVKLSKTKSFGSDKNRLSYLSLAKKKHILP